MYIYVYIYIIYIYIYIYTYIYIYIYRDKIKIHKTMGSVIKQLLETLFLAIKVWTDFTTDVIWMNTMYAVSLANHLKTV